MKYSDGSIYEGEYYYFEKNGYGKFTLADGIVQEGIFDQGNFKNEISRNTQLLLEKINQNFSK